MRASEPDSLMLETLVPNNHPYTEISKEDNPPMRNPTTLPEVVVDIIANVTDAQKAQVVSTPENGLITFHHGWGTRIRNDYNLWKPNTALVKATGAAHPDDASMLIIKAVWQALRDARDT